MLFNSPNLWLLKNGLIDNTYSWEEANIWLMRKWAILHDILNQFQHGYLVKLRLQNKLLSNCTTQILASLINQIWNISDRSAISRLGEFNEMVLIDRFFEYRPPSSRNHNATRKNQKNNLSEWKWTHRADRVCLNLSSKIYEAINCKVLP